MRAVQDVLVRGRWVMYGGFIECGLWASAAFAIGAALGVSNFHASGYPVSAASAAGAFMFGLGAVINGACAFGSVASLASGQLAYLATFPAAALGSVILAQVAGVDSPTPLAIDPPVASGVANSVWIIVVLSLPLARTIAALVAGPGHIWSWLRAGVWPVPLCMAVIALANAMILMSFGNWPWMQLATKWHTAAPAAVPASVLVMLAAVLCGAVLGALTAGRFRWTRPGPVDLLRCLAGGTLMGMGAQLIPGGNDTLVLQSLPLLWPHALLAYVLMSLTIAAATVVARRL